MEGALCYYEVEVWERDGGGRNGKEVKVKREEEEKKERKGE